MSDRDPDATRRVDPAAPDPGRSSGPGTRRPSRLDASELLSAANLTPDELTERNRLLGWVLWPTTRPADVDDAALDRRTRALRRRVADRLRRDFGLELRQ